ncbi:radical SAM protein [Paenibacillus sp. TH7-28]
MNTNYSAQIKVVKKNGKVILLNPENSHWVKMDERVFNKYSTHWAVFCEYLNKRFSLFEPIDKKQSVNNVYYSVTGKCNLNCDFCSMNSGTQVSTKEDLSLEEIKHTLIPKIRAVNPKVIIITGGEPFVRKDIIEILKAFSDTFGKERILLQTNGLLLSKKLIDNFAQYVGAVEISIENIFEHDKLLSKMITSFNQIIDNDCSLKFSFVINKHTAQFLQRAIALTYKYNAACLIRFVSDVGRAATYPSTMSYFEKIDIYQNMVHFVLEHEYFNDNITTMFFSTVQAKTECGGFGRTLGIHANGEIRMCSNLHDEKFKIGNIREHTPDQIANLINVKKQNEEIQNLFLVSKRESCSKCDIQYFCTGPCAAEIVEKEKKSEDIYGDCELKILLVNFMLYNYDRSKSSKENLGNFLHYLNEERAVHTTT